jgi:hypothetical protein
MHMITEAQLHAAMLFAKEHPVEAAALTDAINGMATASQDLASASVRMGAQFNDALTAIAKFERRLAALEGVAGLGDLS